jgi:hypothetical protein
MESTSWEGSWGSQVTKLGPKGAHEGAKGGGKGPQGDPKEAKRGPHIALDNLSPPPPRALLEPISMNF